MSHSPFTSDPFRKTRGERRWDASDYELPPLPYPSHALDGFLSAELLEIHHDRHHRKYVDGCNRVLAELAEARRREDFERIGPLSRALAFHGSGHVLHDLYWHSMSPDGGGDPQGQLRVALEAGFGSVDGFRRHFAAAALQAEGNGWGLLAYEPLGRRLLVCASESHQQMVLQGAVPLLVCDVWEHAYYLSFQNRRKDYVQGFLEVVNWSFAAERLASVVGHD